MDCERYNRAPREGKVEVVAQHFENALNEAFNGNSWETGPMEERDVALKSISTILKLDKQDQLEAFKRVQELNDGDTCQTNGFPRIMLTFTSSEKDGNLDLVSKLSLTSSTKIITGEWTIIPLITQELYQR